MSSSSLWLILTVVGLFALSNGLTRPIFPLFAQDLEVPILFIGLFDSLGMGANAIVRPIAGRASDVLGRKPLVALGLVLAVTGKMIFVLIYPSLAPYMVLVAAIFIGAGAACFWPSLKARLVETYADEKEKAFGYITAVQAASTAVGSALSGALPALVMYRGTFGGAALLLIGALFLISFSRSAPSTARSASQRHNATSVAPSRIRVRLKAILQTRKDVLALCLSFTLLAVAFSTFLSFFALYIRDIYAQSILAIGGIFTIISLARAGAGVSAGPVSQRLLRHVTRPTLIAAEMLLATAIFFFLPLASFHLFIGVHVLLAFLHTLILTSIMALASDLSAGSIGLTIGLLESLGMVSGLGGPIVGGLIYEQYPAFLFPFSGLALFISFLTLIGSTALSPRGIANT